jgi:hypothetical protein
LALKLFGEALASGQLEPLLQQMIAEEMKKEHGI